MNPIFQNEISTRPAVADFTLRLHREIKFHLGKVGQFSTWFLFRFVQYFFTFFFNNFFQFTKTHRYRKLILRILHYSQKAPVLE